VGQTVQSPKYTPTPPPPPPPHPPPPPPPGFTPRSRRKTTLVPADSRTSRIPTSPWAPRGGMSDPAVGRRSSTPSTDKVASIGDTARNRARTRTTSPRRPSAPGWEHPSAGKINYGYNTAKAKRCFAPAGTRLAARDLRQGGQKLSSASSTRRLLGLGRVAVGYPAGAERPWASRSPRTPRENDS